MAKLDYWQRRQAEDMVRYIQSADDTADDIALLYQQASSYIAGKVDDIFEKYRSKHSLSEQEALLLLNTMQDKTSLEELLEKLRSGNADENKKELLAKLEAPAYRARIEHFEQLQGQIDDIAVSIYRQDKQRQTSHYEELAQEAYYRSTYNVQQNTGIDFEFSDVKAKTIEQVINRRWSGKNYSERIWKNTQELAQDLKQELLINLVTGRSNREAAIAIQKKYASGSMVSRRLIWTESCYVATEMNAIAYEEMGIEKYRFCAVLDLKTSAICREMDTREFMLKDRVPGKNCPPMHPWCRSCIIPVIDGAATDRLTRRTRDPLTHKVVKVPYDMTYKQWYEKYVKGKPQVQVEEKKLKNMSVDRKQWEKYRAILQDKIPDSLDKFQDMKYNEIEKWKNLKREKQSTLNKLDFSDITCLKGKLGNKEVRLWYKAHDIAIPDSTDKSLPLKNQAMQAYELRNMYRTQARDLMKNQSERLVLDKKHPNPSFESLVEHKMKKYGLTEQEAYKDIIRSSATTNKKYDKLAGVEEGADNS